MQIDFEPKQIKAAHDYVNRLPNIKKVSKRRIRVIKKDNKIIIEEKPSLFKNMLNFLFK